MMVINAGDFISPLFGSVLHCDIRREKRITINFKALSRNEYCVIKSSAGLRIKCSAAPETTDVIVVGAGVAGAALAYALGKDGREVHIIERDLTEPDRFVGELLHPGGYLRLTELGLQDCLEDIDAQQVLGFAFYKDGKNVKIPYPLDNFPSDVSGRSFHNGRFIQNMRHKASTLPNVRLEQGAVTSLVSEKGIIRGVRYKTKNGEERTSFAPLTVVCDGGFANLSRSLCTSQVDSSSWFVGLVLENCQLPYANYGHLIFADPSSMIFYPISSREVRCIVDVPRQKVPSTAKDQMAIYLKTVVAPQIPPQLYESFIAAIEKRNIRTMTTRSMPANPHPPPGVLLIGDAFNMRQPVTAGGMTVALSDIVVLRNVLRNVRDLSDSATLCKYLDSFYILRKPLASTINILADALYKIVSMSSDPVKQEVQQALFDYLSLGGIFSSSIISVVSGLNPRPVAGGIILPIINAEGVREMFFLATIPAYYRLKFPLINKLSL
ncbi:squalene monooxygenase SE1-like isoform X2 [Andrographis paniculata]|uniref:squalene monooxygenase SE1-like isoform X2 n=1 Tax=Andrographis paniculata TaxID=175694 RepID=UPI0021E94318|nr:squalene monooxygenase SE1-like isoform X2 [Andrographis paniculata]